MCVIVNALSNIDNLKNKQTTFNTKLCALVMVCLRKNVNIRVTLQAALLLRLNIYNTSKKKITNMFK